MWIVPILYAKRDIDCVLISLIADPFASDNITSTVTFQSMMNNDLNLPRCYSNKTYMRQNRNTHFFEVFLLKNE